jgi:hypothetical protein
MHHGNAARLVALAALSLGGCQALTQPLPTKNASICIPSYSIDHTDIPDDNTIIFTMRDHTVYKNTLAYTCTGLRLDTRGFTYEATDPGSDTICSNLVTIHLNTDHNVCQLGEFTKVSTPAHS